MLLFLASKAEREWTKRTFLLLLLSIDIVLLIASANKLLREERKREGKGGGGSSVQINVNGSHSAFTNESLQDSTFFLKEGERDTLRPLSSHGASHSLRA